MYCCLPGCKSIFKPKSAGGVSFHRIPPSHSPLRQKWLDFIKSQNGGKDLSSYRTACLCSNHFTPDCLFVSSQCTRLMKYAVPTILRPGAVPCTSCSYDGSKDTATTALAPKVAASATLEAARQLVISPITMPSTVGDGVSDGHPELRFHSVHVSNNGEVECGDVLKRVSPLMMTDGDDSKSDTEPLSNISRRSNKETQKDRKAKKPEKYLKSLLTQPQKVVCPIKSIELNDDIRHKTAAELKQEIHELENTLARVEKLAKMRERKLKYWSTRNSRLEKTIHSLKVKLKKNMQKEDSEN